jgi:sentrin-specific protease 1
MIANKLTSTEIDRVLSKLKEATQKKTKEDLKNIKVSNSNYSGTLTLYDLTRLVSEYKICWLNDELINFYMWMLSLRDDKLCNQSKNRTKSHFYDVSFMSTFVEQGYDRVKRSSYLVMLLIFLITILNRWTHGKTIINIFKRKKLFFPINVDNLHWVLVIVDIEKKVIEYRDSLEDADNLKASAYMQYIETYLDFELKNRGNDEVISIEWLSKTWDKLLPQDTPKQNNGSDCGVFVCMYADYLLEDKVLAFTQGDMERTRSEMLYYILNYCTI